MRQYENELSKELVKNTLFSNKVQAGIKKLFNKKISTVIDTDILKAKIFTDVTNDLYYLILKRENVYEVYAESKSSYKDQPFTYEMDSLLNDNKNELYGQKLIIFNENKETEKVLDDEKANELLGMINESDVSQEKKDIIFNAYRKVLATSMNKKEDYYTSSAYTLKLFLCFLEEEKVTNTFNLDVLEKNDNFYRIIDNRVQEFAIIIQLFNKAFKQHNFNADNKFVFNDLDNNLWQESNFIMLDEQNVTFAIDFQNEDNFIIYGAIDLSNGKGKKHHSITELLEEIKLNPVDYIDHVALKVVNGKTVYADNSMMYNLDFDLVHTKDELISQINMEVEYPVDIYDFDYQFAYINHLYQADIMYFLMHAFFVLGNGYDYNSETGNIYSNIPYDPQVICREIILVDDGKKFETLGYFWPPEGITKLSEQWLKALEFLVDKIKKDQPDISNTPLPIGKTFEDVMEYLEGIISFNKTNKLKLK